LDTKLEKYMNFRSAVIAQVGIALSLSAVLHAQQTPPAPEDSGLVIQTETKQVLVDAVVTDKKGNYVADLKAKDFHVQEDGKDQPIKSFSFEADPANGGAGKTHYMVLMFDDSSMTAGDQSIARQAAAKFIDANTGPDRKMEVVNFGGSMNVAQDFTSDADRLKKAIGGIQFVSLSSNQGSPQERDAAAYNMLESLRTLAKGLTSVPGRKILVLFTAGVTLSSERMSEATAIISDCNKANVAIYPVDVRGLATGMASPGKARLEVPRVAPARQASPQTSPQATPNAVFQTVAFTPSLPFAPQARGGGASGGASGGTVGGGSKPVVSAPTSSPTAPSRSNPTASPTSPTSTTGGRGGAPVPAVGGGACAGPTTTPNGTVIGQGPGGMQSSACSSRNLIPKIPESATTNQQIMFMLADGTGGFVIYNTNDLLGGLQKIGKEQNQYYLLGYTPPDTKDGACHTLHVKVDRGGTEVRARTGYCSSKPLDVLSGSPVEKTLEAKIAAAAPGPLVTPPAGRQGASMRLPYFYSSPNVARVNVAMEFPAFALKFEKKKDTQHAEVNVMGVAYTPQGTVAARFSDTLKLDYATKEEAEDAKKLPMHYENQFDIASGKYTFKLVFSEGGDNFGKLEAPLEIDTFATSQFAISGLALSKEYHRTADGGADLVLALLEDKKRLVADGIQVVPIGNATFGKSDLAILYVELYEPLLAAPDPKNPPAVAIQMRVLDRKSGDEKADTGMMKVDPLPPAGTSVIPLAEKMPVSKLVPGAYRLELSAVDSEGHTAKRTADFDLQ
jgi:VWFA-related protein